MHEAEAEIGRFIAMLDEAFRCAGAAGGLPAELKAAVLATPRHRFVHRFRLPREDVLNDFDAEPARHLAAIYSDQVLVHVDDAGEALASTNSQPSYILSLLDMLKLQPGHRVLEIGAGSGWLVALMAHLVGPQGHVTGVEILADLAALSRLDLAALGLANVTIHAGDGTHGCAAGAPYDRVIITAATWDVPVALLDQVAEGGLLVIPIAQRGGDCQVTLLRRTGNHLRAERSVLGFFVDLVGATQQDSRARVTLDSLPLWQDVGGAPCLRHPFWLGAAEEDRPGAAALQFRAFLRRTESGFALFGRQDDPSWPGFGLIDEAARSLAVCHAGEVLGYGTPSAARGLARAFERWAQSGLPGQSAFDLEIVRAAAAPAPSDGVWIEPRGESTLVWRLQASSEAWRMLLR